MRGGSGPETAGSPQDQVSLRDYADRLFAEVQRQILDLRRERSDLITSLEKQMDRRFQASEAAVLRANEAMDARLEAMNEFRAQLRDQSTSFITRAEYQSSVETAHTDRNRIAEAQSSFITRLELVGFAEKVDGLQSAVDRSEGRRTVVTAMISLGASLTVSLLVGLILYALAHRA